MSGYETIQKELTRLRLRQTMGTVIPAISIVALIGLTIGSQRSAAAFILMGLVGLPVVSLLLHYIWKALFPTYRQWANRATEITTEIAQLRRRVATIFDRHRERREGEHFKTAYELAGRA